MIKQQLLLLWPLLMAVIIMGSCAVRSKSVNLPEVLPERDPDMVQKNAPILIRTIKLENEAFLVLSKLAAGETAGLKYQCVILGLNGVKEEKGRNIGVRVFLNLPDADQETSYDTPHFVTSFSFGGTDTSIPGDFLFNLKNTIVKLGDDLLKDLDKGELSFTFVPYYFFPEEVANPKDIQLRVAELNLILDCQ